MKSNKKNKSAKEAYDQQRGTMSPVSFFVAACVSLLTFAVYLPALRNGFVGWDDGPYVYDNLHIRTLNWDFIQWAFSDYKTNLWHPLTWISHAVDYAIWGLDPFGHHLTSIVLHALNSGLVVLLTTMLLKTVSAERSSSGGGGVLDARSCITAGGVTGILFGIHPIHVESVAWIAERKDVLYSLFYLLSMICYIRSIPDLNETGGRSTLFTSRWYYYSLVLFFLALCSKPMAVTLPVVLLLLDWYPLKRMSSRTNIVAAAIEKGPYIALSVIVSTVTIMAQKAASGLVPLGEASVAARVINGFHSLMHYLLNLIAPVKLLPLYPYPDPKEITLARAEYLSAMILVFALTGLCLLFLKKQKIWITTWGYFLITVFPVLGLVQAGAQSMADRFVYLPSLGLFVLVGLGLALLWHRSVARSGPFNPYVIAAVLLLAVPLSYLTIKQIAIWRDSFSLWSYEIEKAPTLAEGYYLRGMALRDSNRVDQALKDYTRALEISPKYVSAYVNRGTLLMEKGLIAQAREDFKQAIVIAPGALDARLNLGNVYFKSGEATQALDEYGLVISKDPMYHLAYVNRGAVYVSQGQIENAIEDFTKALLLAPIQPELLFIRGELYVKKGKMNLAVADYQKACDLGLKKACDKLYFPFQ